MTIFTFANNVSTTLASPFSSSATSFTLASSAHLPASIPAGQYLAITLQDAATKSNYEVIYVGTVTGATCSNLLRGQEGTAALSWLTGDFAYSPPTAGQQQSFGQLGATNTWSGGNTFTQPVGVGNAATAGEAITLGQATSTFAQIAGSSSQTFSVAAATTSTQAIPLGQLPSQFPSSLGQNGWKKFPDSNSPSGYFIEQWGVVNLGSAPNQSVTLPIAFPNFFLHCTCSYGSVPTSDETCGCAPGSLSTILIGSASSTINQIWYHARGY
jgi:hypothetical protein